MNLTAARRRSTNRWIVLGVSALLATACASSDDDPVTADRKHATATPAPSTTPHPVTDAATSTSATAAPAGDGSADSATHSTETRYGGPASAYKSTTFAIPFALDVPGWLPSEPTIEQQNFVTWETIDGRLKVRFLVPINVYRPGDMATTPPPDDFLGTSSGRVRMAASSPMSRTRPWAGAPPRS